MDAPTAPRCSNFNRAWSYEIALATPPPGPRRTLCQQYASAMQPPALTDRCCTPATRRAAPVIALGRASQQARPSLAAARVRRATLAIRIGANRKQQKGDGAFRLRPLVHHMQPAPSLLQGALSSNAGLAYSSPSTQWAISSLKACAPSTVTAVVSYSDCSEPSRWNLVMSMRGIATSSGFSSCGTHS